MIRRRLQNWFLNCKDLDLFYLSAGIIILSAHAFKLSLVDITIRNLRSKSNVSARHPGRYLQLEV